MITSYIVPFQPFLDIFKLFVYEIWQKHTKLGVSRENILKPPKIEVEGIFPPNSKKNIKKIEIIGKGKETKRKVTYLLFTLYWI